MDSRSSSMEMVESRESLPTSWNSSLTLSARSSPLSLDGPASAAASITKG